MRPAFPTYTCDLHEEERVMTTDVASATSPGATSLPEPGTWTIDGVHSFVQFTVRHFGVAWARGIASGPTGTITIGEDVTDSKVQASIDASTVTSGNPMRDAELRGPKVLDVEKFPTIEFVSTSLKPSGEGHYQLDGQLTLHGVTRPVSLDVTFNGHLVDTWNKKRLGISAETEIRRSEFDSGQFGSVPLASGGIMVPDNVRVNLELEATKDEAG
jgi:polyisoprenoid-binding protein YceI